MSDLIRNILSLDEAEHPAALAWECMYKHMEEVVSEGVQYSQFEARLKDHRKQMSAAAVRAAKDREAYLRSRELFPRQTVNELGDLVFDMHPAKKLLRRDVKFGLHLGKTPQEFQKTRSEYMEFGAKVFSGRIKQEVRSEIREVCSAS